MPSPAHLSVSLLLVATACTSEPVRLERDLYSANEAGPPTDRGAAGLPPRSTDLDFRESRALLETAADESWVPGGVVAVGDVSGVLWLESFGSLALERTATETETESDPGVRRIYDLASLTKVVGTTSVILRLVAEGRLALDDSVASHLPAFAIAGPRAERELRSRIRVRDLLAHAGGLVAWRPFYRNARSFEELLNAVLRESLAGPPRHTTRYSDLGFILLGAIAAQAGGAPLEELEERLVFAPLGMHETTRSPAPAWRARIAPTERASPDGDFLRGVVHDENARAAAGRTGHAGLFSSAEDIARFARELLRAWRGESELFPRDLLRLFARRAEVVSGSSRALGWDSFSPGGSGGSLLSPVSFGHTGFTGTSLWIDPQREVYLILLTNRVHPTRENRKHLRLRRELADSVMRAIARRRS